MHTRIGCHQGGQYRTHEGMGKSTAGIPGRECENLSVGLECRRRIEKKRYPVSEQRKDVEWPGYGMNTGYLETGAGWTGSLIPMKRWTRKKTDGMILLTYR